MAKCWSFPRSRRSCQWMIHQLLVYSVSPLQLHILYAPRFDHIADLCFTGCGYSRQKEHSSFKNSRCPTSWRLNSPPEAHIYLLGNGRVCIIFPSFHHLTYRPITGKLEDGSQHKNLRVFSSSTGEELISFTQKSLDGWDLQYTISESHAVRLVGPDIQVYRPSEWSKGIIDKLKVEGATSVALSPGLNPSIAVFIAEKKVRTTLLPSVDFS